MAKMSKAEMIRDCLRQTSIDATRQSVRQWVQSHYHQEVGNSINMLSVYKKEVAAEKSNKVSGNGFNKEELYEDDYKYNLIDTTTEKDKGQIILSRLNKFSQVLSNIKDLIHGCGGKEELKKIIDLL